MLRLTPSTPAWLGVVSFVLVPLAVGAACSNNNHDNDGTIGGATSSTGGSAAGSSGAGGAHSGGTRASTAQPTGGKGIAPTGGASAAATGGQPCIAASTDIPPDHQADGSDTQPCSGCHGTAIAGGFVYNPSGSVPVSGATVTLTPTSGAAFTAVTGSKGMFHFSGDIPVPYQACVSKCPDTVCSTVTDHQNAGDCGTCHGVTEPKIHLP